MDFLGSGRVLNQFDQSISQNDFSFRDRYVAPNDEVLRSRGRLAG